MKKLLLLATIVCACTLSANAQDLIVTTGGDTIRGKIIKIEPHFIYYTIDNNASNELRINRSIVASFASNFHNKNAGNKSIDSETAVHSRWKTGTRFGVWGGWGTGLDDIGAINGFTAGMDLQGLVNPWFGAGGMVNLVGVTQNKLTPFNKTKASEYDVFFGPILSLRGVSKGFITIFGIAPGVIIHNGSVKSGMQSVRTSAVALGANISLGLQFRAEGTAIGARIEATIGKTNKVNYKSSGGSSGTLRDADARLSSLGVSAYLSFGNK